MPLTSWLDSFLDLYPVAPYHSRTRPRGAPVRFLAAEIQVLEARELLSAVSADFTPDTTGNAAAGDAMPPSIPTAVLPAGSTSLTVRGVSGDRIAGTYQDAGFNTHGFLYDGTTFTTINPPGAIQTDVAAVSGDNVVGYYFGGGDQHAFLYNAASGSYTKLDPPNSASSYASGVSGQTVVGVFSGSDQSGWHSFVYDGSTLTVLDAPGGFDTTVTGIAGDRIVGSYRTAENPTGDGSLSHGFLYNGSTFTTIDVPGAVNTRVTGVTEDAVFGTYDSESGAVNSFTTTYHFRYDGTTFTTLGRSVPGQPSPPDDGSGSADQSALSSPGTSVAVNFGGAPVEQITAQPTAGNSPDVSASVAATRPKPMSPNILLGLDGPTLAITTTLPIRKPYRTATAGPTLEFGDPSSLL